MRSQATDAAIQYALDIVDVDDKTVSELEESELLNRANLGTFQDSLRAPVHRWFTYPAGFSYKAVEETFRVFRITPGMTVYDPFAGTGTTNLVAKQHGVNSFGVEAHPFVAFVARTKLYWDYNFSTLLDQIDGLIQAIEQKNRETPSDLDLDVVFPELVRKCYSIEKLRQLFACREIVLALPPSPFKDLAKLAVTNILRSAADVATGWPYIAPGKIKNGGKENSKANIPRALRDQLYQMYRDLQEITRNNIAGAETVLIEGDSRERHDLIFTGSVDLAFTSPPYLNNYDYADRTRLELYFWGEAATWGDITKKVRKRLITSATTQIERSIYNKANLLSDDFQQIVPTLASELSVKIAELSKRRLTKGGKKSYDILVAGYFNDMLQVIQETFRVLKPGGELLLILGDSAPYGVYIPTDLYLGEVGKGLGFQRYEVEDLRARGGKWKANPQRHDVPLKECILTLYK